MEGNPFAVTGNRSLRAKCMVWGESGAGKTCFALSWPGACVIDLERGTEPWEGTYQFAALHPKTLDDVYEAVRWLQKNPHPYKSLIVDPFTSYVEMVQKRRSDQILRKSGVEHDTFEMSGFELADWGSVGNEVKQFLRALVSLDMNVVLVCRDKDKYTRTGQKIEATGRTWDTHKATIPWADTRIRLMRKPDGKGGSTFRTLVEKDRGNRLGVSEFEATSPAEIFGAFARGFGIDALTAAPAPTAFVEPPEEKPSVTPAAAAGRQSNGHATAEQVAEFRALAEFYTAAELAAGMKALAADRPEAVSRANMEVALTKMRTRKPAAVESPAAEGVASGSA